MLLVGASALGACEVRPPVIEEGELLILRGPIDVEICAGTFPTMESELAELFARFDHPPHTVEYTWMPLSHVDEVDFFCTSDNVLGCAQGDQIYTRSLAHTHELVHAARNKGIPAVLEEGLATYLDTPTNNRPSKMASRELLLEGLELGTYLVNAQPIEVYERAAHFVSFLVAAWGWDTFLALEQRVASETAYVDSPLSLWQDDFEAVYGQSFAEVWDAYADYPDCPLTQFHRPIHACGLAASGELDGSIDIALDPVTPAAVFMTELDCKSERVLGPVLLRSRHPDRRLAHYAIEVINSLGTTTDVSLIGELDEASRAILTTCGDCWAGTGLMMTAKDPVVEDIPNPGTYALILYTSADSPGPVGVQMQYSFWADL